MTTAKWVEQDMRIQGKKKKKTIYRAWIRKTNMRGKVSRAGKRVRDISPARSSTETPS